MMPTGVHLAQVLSWFKVKRGSKPAADLSGSRELIAWMFVFGVNATVARTADGKFRQWNERVSEGICQKPCLARGAGRQKAFSELWVRLMEFHRELASRAVNNR